MAMSHDAPAPPPLDAVRAALQPDPPWPPHAVLARTREGLAVSYGAAQRMAADLAECEAARAEEREELREELAKVKGELQRAKHAKQQSAAALADVKEELAELQGVAQQEREAAAAAAKRLLAEQHRLVDLHRQQTAELAASWATEAHAAAREARAQEALQRAKHVMAEAKEDLQGDVQTHMRHVLAARHKLLALKRPLGDINVREGKSLY